MNTTELINFKIALVHTSGHKKPEVKILLDDELIFHDFLKKEKNEKEIIEFERTIEENKSYVLKIELCNKISSDTKVDENGAILNDWLLEINQILVDDIELDKLLWNESKYYPNYPKEYLDEAQKSVKVITGCVHMGWNGSWQLEFTSPFYLWLLDRI